MARALRPDVILLDVEMSDMNGFDVLRELKADPALHDIPVIFLSGTVDTKGKVRGLDLGAVDFITKPFDVTELKARLRSALRMQQLVRMLAQRAQLDGLTGLWNRAYFDEYLATEMAEADRHHRPLSLVLCDIDRFKQVNDTHGHPFGDIVLERFAHLLSNQRAGDVACRYGGEEFGIILPSTNSEEAAHVADRIREALQALRWDGLENVVITASFGVTDLLAVDGSLTPENMVLAADRALYAAKDGGRNCVRIANRDGAPIRLSA